MHIYNSFPLRVLSSFLIYLFIDLHVFIFGNFPSSLLTTLFANYTVLTLVFGQTVLIEQCRPRSDKAASNQSLHCLPLIQHHLDTLSGDNMGLVQILEQAWQGNVRTKETL